MSGFDRVIDTLNEHPYLWVLYPLLLILPFVLVVAFCIPLREVCLDALAKRCAFDANKTIALYKAKEL